MNLWNTIGVGLKEISSHKARSLLSMLGIILGVFLLGGDVAPPEVRRELRRLFVVQVVVAAVGASDAATATGLRDVVEAWQERRHSLPYEVDGVVVKVDRLRLHAELLCAQRQEMPRQQGNVVAALAQGRCGLVHGRDRALRLAARERRAARQPGRRVAAFGRAVRAHDGKGDDVAARTAQAALRASSSPLWKASAQSAAKSRFGKTTGGPTTSP